jgi:hypothetical protein
MSDGRYVAQAFENALTALGELNTKTLIEALSHDGIVMSDSNLTLEMLAQRVNVLLGGEAASLIIDRVLMQLDQLSTAPTIRA